MLATCCFCGVRKKIHRNQLPVGRPYHCRCCHGRYLREFNSGGVRSPDFSTYRKLLSLAEKRRDKRGV